MGTILILLILFFPIVFLVIPIFIGPVVRYVFDLFKYRKEYFKDE